MSRSPLQNYQIPSHSNKLLSNHEILLLNSQANRPTSTKADQRYGYAGPRDNPSFLSPVHHQQMDKRHPDGSPIKYNNMMSKGLVEQPRIQQNARSQALQGKGLEEVRRRDESPLVRLLKQNDGYRIPQRRQKDYSESEIENSWDRLMKRPEQEKYQRNQKMNDWKKELEVQIQQKQARKLQEQEIERTKMMKEEYKYRQQIQEMAMNHPENGRLRQAKNLSQENLHIPKAGFYQDYNMPQDSMFVKKSYMLGHEYEYERTPVAKGGKNRQKVEDFSDVLETRPRQRINMFIDHLKEDIINGQKLFMNQMEDLKMHVNQEKRSERFRNLAERNVLGAQRAGFIRGVVPRPADNGVEQGYNEIPAQQRGKGRFQKQVQFMEEAPGMGKMNGGDKDAHDFFAELTNMGKEKEEKQAMKELMNKKTEFVHSNNVSLEEKKVVKKEEPKPVTVKPKSPSKDKEVRKVEVPVKAKEEVVKEVKTVKEVKEEKKEEVEVKKEEPKVEEKVVPVVKVEEKVEKIEKKEVVEVKETFPNLLSQLEEEFSSRKSKGISTERKKPDSLASLPQEKKKELEPVKEVAKVEPTKIEEFVIEQKKPEPASLESLAEGKQVTEIKDLKEFLQSTPKPIEKAQSERTERTSGMGSDSKREETPIDKRKLQNFNFFKDSKRGSVDTVNLDLFEDLLSKEISRGQKPTFKQTKPKNEFLFEGFSASEKKGKNVIKKKYGKPIVIKSEVTMNAIAKVMSENMPYKEEEKLKADPIKKLDQMIDAFFS